MKIKLLSLIMAMLLLNACQDQNNNPTDAQVNNASNDDVKYIHVGPNWDALQKLDVSTSKFKIKTSIKKSYKVGETISVTAKSARSGQLWVVFVDPNDEVSMMFPNKQAPNNTITADKLITLPGDNSDWAIQASEPLGQTIVSFIVTTGEVDLNDVLSSNNESTMNEALSILDTSNQWSIQTHVVSVSE